MWRAETRIWSIIYLFLSDKSRSASATSFFIPGSTLRAFMIQLITFVSSLRSSVLTKFLSLVIIAIMLDLFLLVYLALEFLSICLCFVFPWNCSRTDFLLFSLGHANIFSIFSFLVSIGSFLYLFFWLSDHISTLACESATAAADLIWWYIYHCFLLLAYHHQYQYPKNFTVRRHLQTSGFDQHVLPDINVTSAHDIFILGSDPASIFLRNTSENITYWLDLLADRCYLLSRKDFLAFSKSLRLLSQGSNGASSEGIFPANLFPHADVHSKVWSHIQIFLVCQIHPKIGLLY